MFVPQPHYPDKINFKKIRNQRKLFNVYKIILEGFTFQPFCIYNLLILSFPEKRKKQEAICNYYYLNDIYR